KAFIEALSAETIRTEELQRKQKVTFKLLPTLLPERARALTEVQRANLQVHVLDLDGKAERYDTIPILCLARTSSFNAVRDPATGQPKDLTDYYGAWVTPHVDPILALLYDAAKRCPGGALASYQGDTDAVTTQVRALFETLQAAEIRYVNTVFDFGADGA